MATNEVMWESGRRSLRVGTGTLSGDPVRVGVINAVAITDSAVAVDQGANVGFIPTSSPANANRVPTGNAVGWASCKLFGSFRVPVTVVTTAVSQGDPIYAIANGTGSVKKVTLTNVSTGNKLWGTAMEDAAVGSPLVEVKISEIQA
jgi:hypothetical protein